MNKKFEDYKPDDIVKSCPYLETGSCFELDGMHCCCLGTIISPTIITKDEINENKFDYNLILERKQELFLNINNNDEKAGLCLKCANVKEKKFKDVDLTNIGGQPLPAGFNIQHYTACNERCSYCCYAQTNNFKPPQYDLLKVLDICKKQNHLKKGCWIDFSGGEPAILKDFEKILTYFDENKLGTVVVYSNASIYSHKIYELLKEDKIILTTSIDTGLKSTYAKIRGLDAFPKVFENLLRYRSSGTHNLWLKYIVTEENRTEDDMWSFITAMVALRPDKIMVCPDFPYEEKQIPYETVEFIAKLWCECERILGVQILDFTETFGDAKFIKYHEDLELEIKKYKQINPYIKKCMAPSLAFNLPQCHQKTDYKKKVKKVLPKIKSIVKLSI